MGTEGKKLTKSQRKQRARSIERRKIEAAIKWQVVSVDVLPCSSGNLPNYDELRRKEDIYSPRRVLSGGAFELGKK